MKLKICTAVIFIFLCIITASCAKSNGSDICYLHAVGFDANGENIVMSVLMEKSKENQSSGSQDESTKNTQDNSDTQAQYTVESFSSKSVKECTDMLFKKYPKCYSGRAEIYFLGENLSQKMVYDIATFIPSSPILPAQSSIVCTTGTSVEKTIKTLKTQQDTEALKDMINKEKVNAVKFFSLCTQKNSKVSIPLLTLSHDSKLTQINKVTYKNCAVTAK